jgi:TolB-like protein
LAGVRLALPLLLLALASRSVSAQQCPDGTVPPCGRTPAHAPSVAILFMEPRSRNAADSLLAEGLTLEIINTLSGVARLDVRSRWASRRIAADTDPMRSARALGVDYLVDGVLELDSARVLVRGALTRTSTGRVVRPIRIERRRTDLEGLQVAVAQEVAAAVVGRLLPAERARFAVRRVDPRVTELVLSARALGHQYTAAASRQAIVLARQAIAIDSTYVPAWVFLAAAYVLLRDFELDSTTAFYSRALVASERAFALDSSIGTAMMTVASLRACFNDLSPRTEALVRRGAMLEPGVETDIGLAWVLLGRGKVDEALAVSREAARRDSLSPITWSFAALRFSQARRFVEAAGARERALALRPSAYDSLALQSARRWARLETGDCAGALADGQSAGDAMLTIESLRCLGRTVEADSIIGSRLAIPGLSPGSREIFLVWKNQLDSAFAVLDRAFPPLLVLPLLHPAFNPYRQHPAYLALRRRMGLDR